MAFDPNAFLSTPSDPSPTTYEVTPEGEYQMMLDSDPKTLEVKKIEGVSQRTGEPYLFYQLELNCILIGQAAEAAKVKLGRKELSARLRINLDFDDSGRLSSQPNRNVALGQLRDAVGQNKPGWTPQQLLGAGPFMGRIRHQASRTNPEQKFAEVAKVARIA
jgi:hypothetical protein